MQEVNGGPVCSVCLLQRVPESDCPPLRAGQRHQHCRQVLMSQYSLFYQCSGTACFWRLRRGGGEKRYNLFGVGLAPVSAQDPKQQIKLIEF